MNFDELNKPLDYFSQTNQQLRRMEAGGQDGCTSLIMLVLVIVGLIATNC